MNMQTMVSEEVKVNNQLSGEWHHTTSRKQLIVICHGYQGSSNSPTIIAITNGLNDLGHDTFTFNFSKNMGGFDIEHQVKDITNIVEYFNNYEEVILLAASFATLTASIATIQLSKVKGLVTINGFFGRRNLGSEHFKNYAKFRIAATFVPKYRKILKYFKRKLRPELIEVPVLVIHSLDDTYVLIKQSQTFYDGLISPKRFVELQTADYAITTPADRQKVIVEVHKWILLEKSSEPS